VTRAATLPSPRGRRRRMRRRRARDARADAPSAARPAARRAAAAALAREGDDAIETTGVAVHADEAMRKDPAAQESAKLARDEAGHRSFARCRACEECLEFLLHHPVEVARFGLAARVAPPASDVRIARCTGGRNRSGAHTRAELPASCRAKEKLFALPPARRHAGRGRPCTLRASSRIHAAPPSSHRSACYRVHHSGKPGAVHSRHLGRGGRQPLACEAIAVFVGRVLPVLARRPSRHARVGLIAEPAERFGRDRQQALLVEREVAPRFVIAIVEIGEHVPRE